MAWQTNPPTQAELAKFDDEQAAQAGALADRARDFYTQFSSDTNAPRARVTEIQALQMAMHFGATNRLADLDAREQAVLADTNAPEELRYELRLDLLGRELQAAAAAGADMKAEMEKAGRALVKEFPSGPEGYEILMDLAMNADLLKMHEFGELMANSGGPPELTDLGKGLLRRLDAVGKPLPIEFKAVDGRAVNLTTLSNKVVLVDFWATWCPGCVALSPEIKKLYDQFHTNGFEVVGINFDDDTNQAQRFIKEAGTAVAAVFRRTRSRQQVWPGVFHQRPPRRVAGGPEGHRPRHPRHDGSGGEGRQADGGMKRALGFRFWRGRRFKLRALWTG